MSEELYETKRAQIYDLFDEIIESSRVVEIFLTEEDSTDEGEPDVIPKAELEKRLQIILKNVATLQDILEKVR